MTATWDITKPLDTELFSTVPASIRSTKVDIKSALECEHIFPGSDVANPVAYHKIPYDTTANKPAASASYPNRWYYDTTLNVLQRDTGGTWSTIATKTSQIPAGTKTIFYMAAAPTGWTQTADDALMLKHTNSTGAVTGGGQLTTGSSSHDHTLTTFTLPYADLLPAVTQTGYANGNTVTGVYERFGSPSSDWSSAHTSPVTAYSHSHTATVVPAYVNIIICEKG